MENFRQPVREWLDKNCPDTIEIRVSIAETALKHWLGRRGSVTFTSEAASASSRDYPNLFAKLNITAHSN